MKLESKSEDTLFVFFLHFPQIWESSNLKIAFLKKTIDPLSNDDFPTPFWQQGNLLEIYSCFSNAKELTTIKALVLYTF